MIVKKKNAHLVENLPTTLLVTIRQHEYLVVKIKNISILVKYSEKMKKETNKNVVLKCMPVVEEGIHSPLSLTLCCNFRTIDGG